MYQLVKPLFFLLPAESAHHLTTASLKVVTGTPILGSIVRRLFSFEHVDLEREVFGLKFTNPVGLAAGFDKNGDYIDAMAALGFGFIETGTVTPLPQDGNPKPRLFRLLKDKGILNRMGFNNKGVDHLVKNLKKRQKTKLIIGGNIGKNKITPNEDAWKDYLICFEKLYSHVDYFVVNLSSPNTPGLRDLQEKKPLTKILKVLIDKRKDEEIYRPILLKIAPDLTKGQISDVCEVAQETGIDGLIATNTTIERSQLTEAADIITAMGNGGVSGAPVTAIADKILAKVCTEVGNNIPVIGVGGIHSVPTAKRKIELGAQLIQIYSGMVYSGPFLIKQIKKALV